MVESLGTFRDPAGSLIDAGGSILRAIQPTYAAAFERLLRQEVVESLMARGSLVATRPLAADQVPDRERALQATWFEHRRVEFVSMPAEWSGAMLARAAMHTLEVNGELIEHGLTLKDATPANVLYEGVNPIHVDVPSIEPMMGGSNIWLARNQFETTFLLPLLALAEVGLPLAWSLADPATGLTHAQYATMLGPRRWMGLARIRHVALPVALAGSGRPVSLAASRGTPSRRELERSKYVLLRANDGLKKSVADLATRINSRASVWSDYESVRGHYSPEDLCAKREFVQEVLDVTKPQWVLDIGANAGEFSIMAAERSRVVALDLDEVPVSALFARATDGRLDIQPLVVNLVQPTPAAGWMNRERKSFVQRATGRFDLALMLAVAHHLRVSGGIPWTHIVDEGFALGGGSLLLEFVPSSDPMFQRIARGRDLIYTDNSLECCQAMLERRGTIYLKRTLSNGRTLLAARRDTP